ncbi:hypothetical protein WKV44_05525 [Spirochaetia bacterium 38H-sp]|uniref:DUF5723 domain-containing protein n=1 Tax=Rarispira pelagica TaxID=3141764 RepID=A0ABU9UDG6_9SPIR
MKRIKQFLFIATLFTALFAWAQENTPAQNDSAGLGFAMGISLGVSTFPNSDGTVESYNSIGLVPDISIGKFGIGFNIELNYRFADSNGNPGFEVRTEDWVPNSKTNFFELYLPKIRYIRYGQKGEPIFIKAGTLDGVTLGTGFLVGGYSNGTFLPDLPVWGLVFDLDGNLFSFPFIGMETFVANLSAFDLFGGRFYIRPLAITDIPIIKDLQVGTTFAMDRDPYYYLKKNSEYTGPTSASEPVMIWGADAIQPILSNTIAKLSAFGDVVIQKDTAGSMLGVGGRLFGFLTYGAQMRFLGKNFIPSYFDVAYDQYRAAKYAVYTREVSIPAYTGWLASLGFSVLEDKLAFSATMDGPIGSSEIKPHLLASFVLGEGILPGFFFDAVYDKTNIDSWDAMAKWQEDSYMKLNIHYKSGPAVLTLFYNLRYDLTDTGYEPVVSSGTEVSIQF